MKLPSTPEGWAVRLSKFVKAVGELHGTPRLPIDVASVAIEYSRNVFANEPLTLVRGEALGAKFEGALVPRPNAATKEWGIFYNSSIRSKGRINFTLAHELGHYLLHRGAGPVYCTRRDMWGWDSDYRRMEAEANRFASDVLMPIDDFRVQTADFRRPTLAEFELLCDRYEVSVTAAVLKWLAVTTRRAMIVVSRDGFIDWARGSEPLFRSGVYFKAKKEVVPIPSTSLAASGRDFGPSELSHPAGVWSEREPVLESVIFSEYHDLVLSLLVYPAEAPSRWSDSFDEPELVDTFDKFS